MFRRNFSNWFRLNRVPARALALWLSGLNCLLCCGLAASDDFIEPESAMVEVEARGQDDCRAGQPETDHCPPPGQGQCCILDAPSADLPRAPQLDSSPAAWPASARQFLAPETISLLPFPVDQLRSPNQRETYLRCRVFLI